MKVTWGTYPNNLGHNDFPGCFRCHDDGHKAKDGTTISQDCEMCHKMLDIPASEAQAANWRPKGPRAQGLKGRQAAHRVMRRRLGRTAKEGGT